MKLAQVPQIGPQIGCAYFKSFGMFRAIAGIKNEVKSIIRSCYSFMWSALTKILKKVVGHSIFGGPIWIRNDSKTEFLTYRQAWVAKKLTKIATHIIFFPVKAEMLYFGTVIFGEPIWGSPRRYFDIKNRTLSKNYVKNRTFWWSWEPRAPNRAPNRYQKSWSPFCFLQNRPWIYYCHDFGL